MKTHDYGCSCQDCAGMVAAILACNSAEYFFSDKELAQMAQEKKMERAIVWQLASESDPEQRYIVTTANGETQLSGIFETSKAAQDWIAEHDIPCTASTGECKCLDCWKE